MTNPFFPNWITADLVLRGIVHEHFKPRVSIEHSTINIRFLPDEVQWVIPEEDRETFLVIYNNFAQDIADRVGLSDILSKYLYEMVTPLLSARILNEVEMAIHQLDYQNIVTSKDRLMCLLGIT